MKYEQTIELDKTSLKNLEEWLTDNQGDHRLPEDQTFTRTAVFPNGYEIDVKCCGSDEGTAWTEAVLFLHGSECCCTEPCEEYLGDWKLSHNGNDFTVHVIRPYVH